MQSNPSDYAYFIQLGYYHNFNNSTTTDAKSLFLKDNKSFSMLLEDFYMSLLKGVHIQKIRKVICDEKCLHVVVFYRQRVLTRKNDVTFLDTIIAAASFHIIPQLTLVTWMGVDSSLQFNEEFGATKVDPNKKYIQFQGNFHLGKLLVHLVQKYVSIVVGKVLPICFQCNKMLTNGPRLFYEKLYAFQLIGDYGEPIIEKITSSFPKKLLHSSNEKSQLEWMVIFAPVYLVSNFWMTNPKYKDIVLDNNFVVDFITTIGYAFFCLKSTYLLFEGKDVLDELKLNSRIQNNDIKSYFQKYRSLLGEAEINDDVCHFVTKQILDDDTIDVKDPQANDPVLNYLLKDELNIEEWVEIHDNGQGSLPEEGNCGFLTLSQFLHGTERNYYPIRIFFQYIYQSLSKLPMSHPLLSENTLDFDDVWYHMKDNLDNEFSERILTFVADKNIFSLAETDELHAAYKIPLKYNKKHCSKCPVIIRRRKLHGLGSMIRDTRFWASQLEFNILSRVCNLQIVLLQAFPTRTPIVENMREWRLNMRSRNFDNGKAFPILITLPKEIENTRGMCFMAVVEEAHFVGLKLTKKTKIKSNVQLEIEAWLNDRTDKLLSLDVCKCNSHPVGAMYNVDEILSSSSALLNISEDDRLAIVKALDPLKTDSSEYIGMATYRILTLRKNAWLDCSVIARILFLHQSTVPKTMKLKLWSSYWVSKDYMKKPIQVGYYHLLICNIDDKHWIVLEVDDRVSPRPKKLIVNVCDQFELLKIDDTPWLNKLNEMFSGARLEYTFDKDNDEKQNGIDCGVIALRRAIVRIKVGLDHKIQLTDFEFLGSFDDSRLSFVNLILKNKDEEAKLSFEEQQQIQLLEEEAKLSLKKEEEAKLREQIQRHEEETKRTLEKQQAEHLKQIQRHAEESKLSLENDILEKRKRKNTASHNEGTNPKSPKKLTSKEARLAKKQPRGKVYKPPKNQDYYSDASGEIEDDDVSIDDLQDHWKGLLVARKKQKLKENQKDEWTKYAFDKSQQSNFAMKLIKKEYVDKLEELKLKRTVCLSNLQNAYDDQILNNKSSRKINEKTKKIDFIKNKIKDIDSTINYLQYEMKRKPMFQKFDAIYALKKVPPKINSSKTDFSTSYYGLVKRGKKFLSVEILEEWLDSLFEKKFLDLFEMRNKNNVWCTMGCVTKDEVTIVPKRSYDYDLFLKTPINRYDDPNKDTGPKALVRKIKITCLFAPDEETMFKCTKREYAILCPKCTDDEFPTLASHEYEAVAEECLKDDIGVDFVIECTEKCYELYFNETVNKLEIPTEFVDEKDTFVQNKTDDIFLDKSNCYYFDCTHLNFKCNLSHPQVSKIKYNPTTNEFSGMSVMVNETGNMVEKFPLSTEWVEENYTKEIVNAIKNKAIKLANGRYLSVPVGDVIDQDVIDNMVFDPNAPDFFIYKV